MSQPLKDMPSPATMIGRTFRVKDAVAETLVKYPQGWGDYRILDWRFCQLFTGVRIRFSDFKKLRACPSFDTIHRKFREYRQEYIAKHGRGSVPEMHGTRIKRYALAEAWRRLEGQQTLMPIDYCSPSIRGLPEED